MTTSTLTEAAPQLAVRDEQVRRDLARTLVALFARWELTTAEQMLLLGMSPESRKLVRAYQRGDQPLPDSRDCLDRAGYLLGIHKGLRLLFPEDEALRWSWVKRRNSALAGERPLDVMLAGGLIGIARVARLVDFQRGQ
ncbi:MbcA/ParS/Xre antitoxin family protein [Pseudofulvimonas gallinarii]|jgi:hypothetical protein|uniref:Uncharacterized protein DUF2384 n=1 Tax=Pseudofulvimonas gallinarii TaxID=634155 RepID=A0A4S3KVC3_9GAMM|nr:antitoxin Xre/MbcA/ParS toxin-binding domain-containing protein [Pseudofulvimonas gallinarii]TCS97357.1 uncharacterized protein DUF2384 [Pseudofulvimonas gallinarii]THD13193.1 hypothetical protein B1808_09220 [Pseudofulvimonas gallinarii]